MVTVFPAYISFVFFPLITFYPHLKIPKESPSLLLSFLSFVQYPLRKWKQKKKKQRKQKEKKKQLFCCSHLILEPDMIWNVKKKLVVKSEKSRETTKNEFDQTYFEWMLKARKWDFSSLAFLVPTSLFRFYVLISL